ncbi:hypothetical protein [Burkholderia sp. Z1]|uniref:hypothetical protein n=1 Tax=Burkholderia sp. Z1 TaxID=2759039 RepID=UPI001865DC93|nr:hypothetical protein [Burkholderia sp. Z1]
MSFVRNALAIVLFTIAGTCLITAQTAVFIDAGHPVVMLAFVGGLFAFSAVLLVAGAFAGKFRPRARSAGIALLVATAISALGTMGWATILLSPEIVDTMRQQGLEVAARMFRFWPSGITVTAVSALVGVGLVRRG